MKKFLFVMFILFSISGISYSGIFKERLCYKTYKLYRICYEYGLVGGNCSNIALYTYIHGINSGLLPNIAKSISRICFDSCSLGITGFPMLSYPVFRNVVCNIH